MQAQEHKVHLKKKKMASLQLHLFCVKIVGTMTHLSLPVLLNLYQGRQQLGVTFCFLLPVISTVTAGVKTDADCGEGMMINNENYDGFCKRAFVCFCYCFSASTSFSDVCCSGVCSLGNKAEECTEEDWSLFLSLCLSFCMRLPI